MVESMSSVTLPVMLQGRYRMGQIIGRGGASTVYRARDLLLGRDVAIKVFTTRATSAEDLRVAGGRGAHARSAEPPGPRRAAGRGRRPHRRDRAADVPRHGVRRRPRSPQPPPRRERLTRFEVAYLALGPAQRARLRARARHHPPGPEAGERAPRAGSRPPRARQAHGLRHRRAAPGSRRSRSRRPRGTAAYLSPEQVEGRATGPGDGHLLTGPGAAGGPHRSSHISGRAWSSPRSPASTWTRRSRLDLPGRPRRAPAADDGARSPATGPSAADAAADVPRGHPAAPRGPAAAGSRPRIRAPRGTSRLQPARHTSGHRVRPHHRIRRADLRRPCRGDQPRRRGPGMAEVPAGPRHLGARSHARPRCHRQPARGRRSSSRTSPPIRAPRTCRQPTHRRTGSTRGSHSSPRSGHNLGSFAIADTGHISCHRPRSPPSRTSRRWRCTRWNCAGPRGGPRWVRSACRLPLKTEEAVCRDPSTTGPADEHFLGCPS